MNIKRMEELRKEKGVTQRDVSIGTGITEGTLWKLEKGLYANPTINTLTKIVDYYGVPVSELLD